MSGTAQEAMICSVVSEVRTPRTVGRSQEGQTSRVWKNVTFFMSV